ncbi:MAG: cation diffusion facilitator family transporter [Bacteroidales bacterium]|nr:cation diffusion facilitator family transporter [Bacteroidales bacterium]
MHKTTGHLSKERESRNLFITVFLNIIIAVAELIGGLLSNSLALISDAIHNLSDGIAMLITYVTVKVSKRQNNQRKTFGYKRIQILAALFNALTLIAICIFLIFEAYKRFIQPEEIDSIPMLFVAAIGLVANLAGVFLLKDFKSGNINIKAAYLHLIGDTLSSVAVIVGGILIYFYNIYWVDPLVTVLISVYIIRETYHVLSETYNILMQAVPAGIDLEAVRQEIIAIEGIKDLHHVHVWSLTDHEVHFEGHLELSADMPISDAQLITEKAREKLKNIFDIQHITLQLEINYCKTPSLVVPQHEC